MSNSYRSDKDTRAPSRFLTPQEEYDRGLRRRPKGSSYFETEDKEDLTDTDNMVVQDEDED
jgi:hypothetical protein